MKLYNTLTRNVEDFRPQKPGTVSLYTCGPTVYNYYHIGNLRNAVFNDTLRRTLEAKRFNVKHVMNITDVGHLVSDEDEGEDKLEKGAKREGKTVWEVAKHYTAAFKHDMSAMNVLPPNAYRSKKYGDSYARATEFIDAQIAMVRLLIEEGFAYQTRQAIYFDVTKLPDYGILSGQKLLDKEVGARSEVVTDSEKRHPYDFAVWFFAVERFKDHSMQWESPWGSGFPGWHLECSAIIHGTLGDPIDIHTGGVDHIGTHHPNEMAQTEAAFGHPLANYWVHNEFILVDGAKMSKSKNNSYTLRDITEKGFDPLALRLLYLQAHYRSELNFSWENLEAAQNRLIALRAFADLRFQVFYEMSGTSDDFFFNKMQQMKNELENDLNTPKALGLLSEVIAETEERGVDPRDHDFELLLEFLDNIFGLGLQESTDINQELKSLITERENARGKKDWAKSDDLRDKLTAHGIVIRDTNRGPIWSRL